MISHREGDQIFLSRTQNFSEQSIFSGRYVCQSMGCRVNYLPPLFDTARCSPCLFRLLRYCGRLLTPNWWRLNLWVQSLLPCTYELSRRVIPVRSIVWAPSFRLSYSEDTASVCRLVWLLWRHHKLSLDLRFFWTSQCAVKQYYYM